MLSVITRKRSARSLAGAMCAVAGLSFTAAAAAAVPGSYVGATSQHLPIVVNLSQNQMRAAAYKAKFTCKKNGRKPVSAIEITKLPATRLRHGKIEKKFHLYHGSDLTLFAAAAHNKTISGGFREVYMSQTHYLCDSGIVYFKASRQ